MKRILSVILSIFVASSAIAQEPGFQNEADSTVASTAGTATKLATDSKGKLRLAASAGSNDFTGAMPIAPLAVGTDTAETDSTTTVILATSHAARVGDYVKFTGGTAANINVWRRVSAVATNSITVPVAFPSAPANGDAFTIYRPVPNSVTYAEDSAHTSADLGHFMLGVANPSRATLAADGDYTALATTVHGAMMVSLDATAVTSAGNQPVRTEDSPFAAADAVMVMGARYIGNNAFGPSAGTANDITTLDVDSDNRLAVNAFGANATNFYSSCGTATASTSNVAIKAAGGGSVRNYVSTITCSSSDADNATDLAFKDGTTVVAVGGVSQMAAGAAGSFTANFSPPIRGTGNTAFNFATNVSTSSVVCCAQGFTSSN